MKPKFTPGPWSPGHYERSNKCFVVAKGSHIFEETTSATGEISPNAHLIAAAPDMFEALENIQRYLERSGEASLLDSFGVNEALAKARGEE